MANDGQENHVMAVRSQFEEALSLLEQGKEFLSMGIVNDQRTLHSFMENKKRLKEQKLHRVLLRNFVQVQLNGTGNIVLFYILLHNIMLNLHFFTNSSSISLLCS